MPRFATIWLWIAAVALVAGGCSTFGATEQDLAAVAEQTDLGPANQPASLSNAAQADATEGDDAQPVTVHVSDPAADASVVADPSSATTAYRSANDVSARSDYRRDSAGPSPENANVPRGSSQSSEKEQAETFDQLMTEARRRGALSASEEASFRRDLADVPAHLRPQMAAMLLAVRNRREGPPGATASIGAPPLEHDATMTDATADLAANSAATTSERLARIAARTPPASSLDENPLRALVAAAENANGKSSPGRATGDAISPRIASSIALSASNQPGEVGRGAARSGSPSDASARTESRLALGSRPPLDKSGAAPVREARPARRATDEATLEEWQVMLGATIRALEAKLAAAPDDQDNPRRQALLRLLYLAANRLEDTAKAMPADAGEQQFWIDWLYGTSVYLDAESTPNEGQRAAIAVERLREAVHRLGEQANLLVSNVAFCRRVTSFGVYEPFTAKPGSAKYEFTANQEVLLYAEVRNFTSVPTAKGRHTLLRPSYQIFDAQGRRLGPVVELDESHDYCQNQRTDFFVCYHIYLPTRIDPGEYKLKLTIEDVHGGKVHENSVDFAIKRG